MATFYITCRSMALTPMCGHWHVASVVYFDANHGSHGQAATREEMIRLLSMPGNEAYTYGDSGSSAKVYVHTCRGHVPYLTTVADDTRQDNLDNLKPCSN